MSFDKTNPDGTVVKAPALTRRVLETVPILFQLSEWLLVIVAFQYADIRLGYFSAKIAWYVLGFALALYVGFLSSNAWWRAVDDPYKSLPWRLASFVGVPAAVFAVMYFLQYLAAQMVAAQA